MGKSSLDEIWYAKWAVRNRIPIPFEGYLPSFESMYEEFFVRYPGYKNDSLDIVLENWSRHLEAEALYLQWVSDKIKIELLALGDIAETEYAASSRAQGDG